MLCIDIIIKEEIKKYRKFLADADVSVFYSDLVQSSMFGINPDLVGWAASMIKLPILMAVMHNYDKGNLDIEDKLKIRKDYALGKSRLLLLPDNSEAKIEHLLSLMIIESDNMATNHVADYIGISEINYLAAMLGCESTRMSHLLMKGAKIEDGGIDGKGSNTTSASDMAQMMSFIYNPGFFSKRSRCLMQSMLEYRGRAYRNVNNFFKPSLPFRTIIGAKSGLLENDIMESAVINREYILCVMVNKVQKKSMWAAESLMRYISGTVYNWHYRGKKCIG